MTEKTNYEKATMGLKELAGKEHLSGFDIAATVLNAYASLALTDAVIELKEVVRSYGMGDAQGGRSLEVNTK